MKKMTKSMKTLFAMLVMVMAIALVPMVKTNAQTTKPAKPTGVNLYDQDGSKAVICWTLDNNLPLYSSEYAGYFGYEIVVSDLKGKAFLTETRTNYQSSSDFGSLSSDRSKVGFSFSNSKIKTQGFKIKVRSFVYDENQNPVYSDYSSEKLIIPRATIKKGKFVKNKVKISWTKVKGAKSYTIYLSSNDGKKFKKLGTTKKASYTISKKLKRYKDYYVYVQANGVKYKKKKYNSSKPSQKVANAYKFYIYTTYR